LTENDIQQEQYNIWERPNLMWKAAYQIWSLNTRTQVLAFQFAIPAAQILDFPVQPSHCQHQPKEFRFPVVLSSSLRVAVILGTAIQISQSEDDPEKYHCELQEFLNLGCQSTRVYDSILDVVEQPLYASRHELDRLHGEDQQKHCAQHISCHKWSQRYFNPNERFLAILNGRAASYGPSANPWASDQRWVLDIYENRGNPKVPNFELIASVGIQCNNKTTESLCFHPFESMIAICTINRTVIWRFEDKGRFSVPVQDILAHDLRELFLGGV
jgi:hypothetical protein